MAGIGEIVTQAELESARRYAAQTASVTGYVAPTIYRNQTGILGINLYSTLLVALRQLAYLYGTAGVVKQTPVTSYTPTGTAAATLGYNVDFFIPYNNTGALCVPYLFVREKVVAGKTFLCVVRMSHPSTGATYYAIFDTRYHSIAATKITNIPADKVAAMDAFHREVQVLKFRYNALSGYVNTLSQKQLNPVEQQVFNRALVLLRNFEQEIRTVQKITITFSNGSIAIPWLLIALIVVGSGIVLWSVSQIVAETNKTKRISDAYDIQKFIAEQNAAIAANPNLTDQQKKDLIAANNNVSNAAQNNAKEETKNKGGFMEHLQELAFTVVGGFILYNLTKSKKNG